MGSIDLPFANRLVLVPAIATFACLASAQDVPPRPNIVLISIDTLRADHCSLYGYQRDTTPFLEQLGDRGAVFNQAYAPMGQTTPSHATMLTGLYPPAHGVVENGLALAEDAITLAERLGNLGYDTAAFVSAFPLDRRFGLDQGFDVYDADFQPGQNTLPYTRWEGQNLENAFDRRGDFTAGQAVRWLESRRGNEKPLFMFVHFFDPHSPYRPPLEMVQRLIGRKEPQGDLAKQVALYDSEIRFADSLLQLVVTKSLELADDTLIIVTADHGEGLMQRGYFLHGNEVYEEEVRVPLVFVWPERIRAGRRFNPPVTIADITPTILELVGAGESKPPLQGQSLAPALTRNANVDPDRPLFLMRPYYEPQMMSPGWRGVLDDGSLPEAFHVEGAKYGVRRGPWKYIVATAGRTEELYDLSVDPRERSNVVTKHPDIAKSLADWLARHADLNAANPVIDDDTRERLRALGYVN